MIDARTHLVSAEVDKLLAATKGSRNEARHRARPCVSRAAWEAGTLRLVTPAASGDAPYAH